MIEIGITKKQHYVSQGILKHFADYQKKIFELFKDEIPKEYFEYLLIKE